MVLPINALVSDNGTIRRDMDSIRCSCYNKPSNDLEL